ncbi:MAG: hypothetical protein IK088_09280 [Lachnospiraceae bacterium]|nr:hypothetical protein [Lachnospiraceae bacterium]
MIKECITKTFLEAPPIIDLHDAYITYVEYQHERLRFFFRDGFRIINDENKAFRTGEGVVDVLGCELDDLSIYYFKRFSNKKGLKLKGRKSDLPKLIESINNGTISIGLCDICYGNSILWKGWIEQSNGKKFRVHRRLEDEVLIRITSHDWPKLEFSWENRMECPD